MPATFTIESSCGDVVVGITGSVLEVVEVRSSPGVQPDVKSAGPETVEVSFEGGGRRCELAAKVSSDGLWISVDNEAAPSPGGGERERDGEGEEGH